MSDGASHGYRESHPLTEKEFNVKKQNLVKDSGSRQTFSTGAQKEDPTIDKGRFDLIPPGPMHKVAQIYAAGAVKYADRNWQKGINVSRILDSLKRHLNQFEKGLEDEPHLYQLLWNAIALVYTVDAVRDGLLPAELLDIPCYMPANAPNPTEWRKENRLVDGFLKGK